MSGVSLAAWFIIYKQIHLNSLKVLFFSLIEFTVYLPDLLDSGNVDQGVETHIIEPTEPIDVRRNRQLTLDNMRLNRELVKSVLSVAT
jgi:hypothetical protein